MKKRSFALAVAFVLALVLTGCSADREVNSLEPGSSAWIGGTADGNDALQGGGAGGTNDRNNDGLPDSSAGPDGRSSGSGMGQAADDIGRAAGDLARGAGDAARDAGNAVGNAADGVGRAMR